MELFHNDSMDECHLIYTERKCNFTNSKVNTSSSIKRVRQEQTKDDQINKSYDFEPSEEEILNEIIPKKYCNSNSHSPS